MSAYNIIRGESAEGKTFESKAACYPVQNGIVQGTYMFRGKEYSFEFHVRQNLYIHDAYEGKDGSLSYSLRGISHEYLLSGIWKEVRGEQAKRNRVVTIGFLKQIERAIEAQQTYVSTVFGLKYIYYPKRKEEENIDFDIPAELLGEEVIK